MRPPSILLAVLLLAPLSAAGSVSLSDPRGDVSLWTTTVPLARAGCAAASIDATDLTVASDGATLTVSLSVVDLAEDDVQCLGNGADPNNGLRTWTVDMDLVSRAAPDLAFTASESTGVARACAIVSWPSSGMGAGSPGQQWCHTPALAGTALTWTLPLAGTAANRTYDLRGIDAAAGAQTTFGVFVGPLASDQVPKALVGTL